MQKAIKKESTLMKAEKKKEEIISIAPKKVQSNIKCTKKL